jgi:quinol monooxygenase YgiN
MANMISTLAILPMAFWPERNYLVQAGMRASKTLALPVLVHSFERIQLKEKTMYTVALFARLEAKAGKEKEVAKFLEKGLSLANQETTTPVWFALRLGPTTFGVFDAFADESGRQAHLNGPIAKALMAKAPELFSKPPAIEQIEVLGAKVPR